MKCKECGKYYKRRHNCKGDKKITIKAITLAETKRHQKIIKKQKDESKSRSI